MNNNPYFITLCLCRRLKSSRSQEIYADDIVVLCCSWKAEQPLFGRRTFTQDERGEDAYLRQQWHHIKRNHFVRHLKCIIWDNVMQDKYFHEER